ncbi:MAG: hypothetical protein ACI90V_010992 [Bacillariaceae sp.]|jgi:hypothetical protein
MRRGSRKKQQQQQDSSSSSSRGGGGEEELQQRPIAAVVPTKRQQPPQEVLQQQRKKHQDEVSSLTTKNYRLAKELVRIIYIKLVFFFNVRFGSTFKKVFLPRQRRMILKRQNEIRLNKK